MFEDGNAWVVCLKECKKKKLQKDKKGNEFSHKYDQKTHPKNLQIMTL